jgi:hypothetical protein
MAVAKDVSRKAGVREESEKKPLVSQKATEEAIEALRRVRELDKKWGVGHNVYPDLSDE